MNLKIRKIKVFEEVENEGQRVMSVRWVITKKNKDQLTYKARLVPGGFEEPGKDNIRIDSPTCWKENFRFKFHCFTQMEN